jgi:hypothetical protein
MRQCVKSKPQEATPRYSIRPHGKPAKPFETITVNEGFIDIENC